MSEYVRKWAKTRIEVTAADLARWNGQPVVGHKSGRLEGPCPACGHHTEETLAWGSDVLIHALTAPTAPRLDLLAYNVENQRAVHVRIDEVDPASLDRGIMEHARSVRKRNPPKPERVEVVHCQCGQDHAGRPVDDEYEGCGRYWVAELMRSPATGDWKVGPADPSYWPQAELLDLSERDRRARDKASAEGWSKAMVGLLAVLVVGGLAVSREVAQTVGFWPRLAIFAALVAAAGCAFLALSKAQAAASGVPTMVAVSTVDDPSGAGAVAARESSDIGAAITAARRWATWSAVAVAVGTLLLWFAGNPEPIATQVHILPADVCGTLVDAEAPDVIAVRPAKGMDPVRVPVGTVTRIDVVDACP